MDEMDACEDVDAATGQKTAAESVKRKRQRVDVAEEPVSQLDEVESAPAKKKVRMLQVCIIWNL